VTGPGVDPRYTLANERTFLAWIRTALGMLAAAAGLLAIDLSWPEVAVQGIASFLAVVAGISAGLAWIRWRRVEEAIAHDRPMPESRAHVFLAVAVGTVAVAVVVLALL
jgi:putative membrane protein